MAVISGKFAEVLIGTCNLLQFESIDMNEGSEPQQYNSREGGGHTKSVAGVNSGDGTLTTFLDLASPLWADVVSGTSYTMTHNLNSDGSETASGTIRIGKISRTSNRDGTPQSVSVAFVTESWTEYTG